MLGPLSLLPAPWQRWIADHAILLQRLIIIPAVLLVSFILARRTSSNITLLIAALPTLLVGFLVLRRWLALGLVILVATSLAFPQEIVYAIGFTTLAVLGLAGFWLFDMFVRYQRITITPFRPLLPFFLLIVVGVLSLLTAQFPYYPIDPAPLDAQIGGLLIIVVAFLVFLMAAHQITNICWLKAITFTFLGIGGTYMALQFIPGTDRLQALIMNNRLLVHSMFWTWLAALSFSQALFNKQLPVHWRAAMLFIAASVFYRGLVQTTDWVSGWLPPLIAIVIIVWIARPRIAYFLTLIGILAFASQQEYILNNIIYVGDNQYSEMTRLEAWRIVFEITSANPLLGVGFANYSFYTPLFPILGWFVQFNSHNNYVDIIAQIGILGMLCLVWLFVEIGRVGWRVYALMKDETDGFVQAYVYGTLGGFAATIASGMLGDWLLPYVYNITIRGMRAAILPWLFLGGLVALEHIIIRQRANQNEQGPG